MESLGLELKDLFLLLFVPVFTLFSKFVKYYVDSFNCFFDLTDSEKVEAIDYINKAGGDNTSIAKYRNKLMCNKYMVNYNLKLTRHAINFFLINERKNKSITTAIFTSNGFFSFKDNQISLRKTAFIIPVCTAIITLGLMATILPVSTHINNHFVKFLAQLACIVCFFMYLYLTFKLTGRATALALNKTRFNDFLSGNLG